MNGVCYGQNISSPSSLRERVEPVLSPSIVRPEPVRSSVEGPVEGSELMSANAQDRFAEGVREITLHISPFHFDLKNKLGLYFPLLKGWRKWKFRAG
jgi:hypothetical protein